MTVTPEAGIAAPRARADLERAARMRAYRKVDRPCPGLLNAVTTGLANAWLTGPRGGSRQACAVLPPMRMRSR